MTKECICWLKGLIKGDGYTDQRHVEIYNSSRSILTRSVSDLKRLIDTSRIKVDIYSEFPKNELLSKWARILEIPKENITLRKNTSQWKSRTEKIRVRVSSKETASLLSKKPRHLKEYLGGLFDAEASVDIKGYIEFKQKTNDKGLEIVNNVSDILKDLSINSTDVKTKNDRNIKRDSYLYVKDIESFQKKIGFVDSEKKHKLRELISIRKQMN